MYCKRCGMENRDDARFCWNCGTCLVEKNGNGQREQQQNSFGGDSYNQTGYNQNSYNQGSYGGDPYNRNHGGNDPFYNPYNPYNPYAYPAPKSHDPARGMAVAAFVLGLISIFLFGIIAGPLGIIFGSVAKGKGSRSAFATLGIVFGIIGLVGVIAMYIACPDLITGYYY